MITLNFVIVLFLVIHTIHGDTNENSSNREVDFASVPVAIVYDDFGSIQGKTSVSNEPIGKNVEKVRSTTLRANNQQEPIETTTKVMSSKAPRKTQGGNKRYEYQIPVAVVYDSTTKSQRIDKSNSKKGSNSKNQSDVDKHEPSGPINLFKSASSEMVKENRVKSTRKSHTDKSNETPTAKPRTIVKRRNPASTIESNTQPILKSTPEVRVITTTPNSFKTHNEANDMSFESEYDMVPNIVVMHKESDDLLQNKERIADLTHKEDAGKNNPQENKNDKLKQNKAPEPVVPITNSKIVLYAKNGEFHYSYEDGKGTTKAFENGIPKAFEDDKIGEAAEGGFAYDDNEGKTSLTDTADENGERPVGAHPPTPRRHLTTKATPIMTEDFNEKSEFDYGKEDDEEKYLNPE